MILTHSGCVCTITAMSESIEQPQSASAPAKAKKARSPGYPGIDLKTAVERARELWRAQQGNYANVGTILHHWGYKPHSGAGLVALAALKKFGFIEDDGSGQTRRARLTDEARA